MNAYFYSLDQTTLNHTINMNSFSEDPQGISGIDFHTQEARTCKISFFDDDWSNANLRNLSSADCIDNTDILKMAVTISNKTYYLQRVDVKYDKKTLTFTLSGIDLLGVLLILGNNDKVFPAELTSALELLETTIDEIFEADANIQYSIDSSAATQSTLINDFQVSFIHNDIFTGEPLFDIGYEPYYPYEADIRFRYIGELDGYNNPVVIMVNWKGLSYDQEEERGYLTMEYFLGELIDEVLIQTIYFSEFEGGISKTSLDARWAWLLSMFSSVGFPETSDLEFSNVDGEYAITDSKLYFSGDVYFDNVKLVEGEEDSGEVEITPNSVLKSLLSLNNLYIYADGNVIHIGNKTSFGGESDETIADNDVVEYKESHIVFKNLDFESLMKIFYNGTNLARFLNYYYSELMGTLNMKITAIIVNNYTLNLLTGATIYGNNFSIVKTHLDNDEIFYSIEGWN